MEQKNDIQDVDLENNESQVDEAVSNETSSDEETQKSEREQELEAEVSKYKRLLAKKDKKSEPKVEPQSQPDSSPNELTDGQIAILRTEGIKSKDERALFTEIMAETGKGVMDLLDSKYFQSRLAEFRENKASTEAVPKGKGRPGQTGATDVDMAIAKYRESGELPVDFKTRSAVVKAMEAEETTGGMFDGPSVIGPR